LLAEAVPTHPTTHFLWTIGLLAAAAAATAAVRTRIVKRRLLFSQTLFLIAIAIHVAILEYPVLRAQLETAEYFIIVCGAVSAGVTLLLNPWLRERPGEGVPAIVQDTVIAVLVSVASLFVFQSSSFIVGITGSAIVIGLALQDTLGNAFAGLAIQVERPFRVGQWITAADHEGRVVEITWRATKIRTKAGNLVVLPNSVVAQQAIHNYSEPTPRTRLVVEVGASYGTPPNEARDAIMTAMRRAERILPDPPPEVVLGDFGASALTYWAWFWTEDFERDEILKSQVRTAIYYEFKRRNIEIPWPIQIEYHREEVPPDVDAERADRRRVIAGVPVLAALPEAGQVALAAAANERIFGDREVIVREGDTGGTMFIVRRGGVAITIGAEQTLVAVTQAGGYFGEMSLLTGEPRTATVMARGDCVVLEIAADAFREYVQGHPEVLEQLAAAAALRRRELDETRATVPVPSPAERHSLVQRMRTFFGLD
jgi:small-conductance mechanosensitive channel/CRP-like cAMP-binding protein